MNTPTRRQFLGASVALGTAATSLKASKAADSSGSCAARTMVEPLAQEYTIAVRQITKDHYMHDPGMARLPDGTIFVAAPCNEWQHKRVLRNTRSKRHIVGRRLLLSRSSDGGKTWESLTPMPYGDATPFVHDDTLYMRVVCSGCCPTCPPIHRASFATETSCSRSDTMAVQAMSEGF
jgi:hypothetical protein